MKNVWANRLVWVGVVLAALALAMATPRETSVMGRLPTLTGHWVAQQPLNLQKVDLPQGLPAERTLALVTFHRDQRKDADSWIQGLQLETDPSIAWVRMPVINNVGDAAARSAAEDRLRTRYATEAERKNLMPVFTDRAAFVQSAALASVDQAYVLVINRNGEVLARVSGQYDETKAQALRETLRERGF